MKIYQARYVLPMSAPPLEDGGVVVHQGMIVAVGPSADLKRQFSSATFHDLGDVILMPGLINAHCHLDYTMMRHQLQSGSGFTSWIQGLNKIKFSLSQEDVVAAIVQGWEELYSWGCTSIANIVSFPTLLEKLPAPPLRLWQLMEVMDIRGLQQGEEGLQITEDLLKKNQENNADEKITFGISPHAPQTTSQGLYRGAAQLAQRYHVPFCTHLAESEEEFEMFTKGNGPLFDFLKNFGRDMNDCGFQTPVQALLSQDLLPRGALLVHMNCLTGKDRELLAQRGNDFFIVHCPKTHRFFERAPFDWKFFQKNKYPLLLGTDSLASNDELNLFSEMQLMASTAPELALEEILKMVTLHPAKALGMKGRLGELGVGAFADMITIPFSGKKQDVVETVLHNKKFPVICSL
jgi:cytosine/adenosine deaminase-related metal-dependent hydrolase